MPSKTTELCPACSKLGRGLKPETVHSLLLPERAVELDQLEGFLFCATQGCAVVWYRPRDGRTFGVRDLSVEVGRKSASSNRLVCYCFDHRAGAIQQDGEAIYASIGAACKAGLDRCEQTNPEGRCCLVEVRSVIRASGASGEPVVQSTADCCAPARHPRASTNSGGARSLATTGAVVAAVLSSACCWLPLAALGFGASAAGVAGFFEAWRWPLVGLSSTLLLGAFYLVYRRAPACDDGVCDPTFGRAGFTKALLWVATVLVAAFALLPEYIGPLLATDVAPAAVQAAAATGSAQSVRTLRIEGMSCEGCATHLHAALSEVPGIARVEVSYAKKTARLWVSPDVEVAAPVKKAVESLGYRIADDS